MTYKNILLLCLLCTTTLSHKLNGQESRQVNAVRVESPPTIDGKLNDAVWQSLPAMDSFTQYYPVNGASPSKQTEMKVSPDQSSNR